MSLFPAVTYFKRGQDVEIRCSAIGPPNPEIQWLRENKQLAGNTNDSGVLYLSNSTSDDEGVYICVARNFFGEARRQISVVYLSEPHFVLRSPEMLTASVSSTVFLHCQAEGAPKPKITWTPPCGTTPDHMEILENGTLILSGVSAWDTGIYECSATSFGGKSSAKTHLIVPAGKFGSFEVLNGCDVFILVDTSWKLSDSCSGFRQSRYDKRVYYQASSSTTWTKSRFYYCPKGYHWACTSEGKEIFGDNSGWSGQYVYWGLCGWRNYQYSPYSGKYRYYFRFRDSSTTNAHKHSGQYEEYKLQYSSDINYFAGIVCIRN